MANEKDCLIHQASLGETREYSPKDDIVHAQGKLQYKSLCRISEPASLSYYVGDVTCTRCLRWTSQMAETRLRRKQSRRGVKADDPT